MNKVIQLEWITPGKSWSGIGSQPEEILGWLEDGIYSDSLGN